jgi:hypothetical protein
MPQFQPQFQFPRNFQPHGQFPQTMPAQQQPPSSSPAVHQISVNDHTRFLSSLIRHDKAFRVPAIIRVSNKKIMLNKRETQANQDSNMNVVSPKLVRQHNFQLRSLAEVGFAGMSIRTTDHKDTLLHYWIFLKIGIKDIWRTIRLFVRPESTNTSGTDNLSLILGLPWLYAINATFSIRGSSILVSDSAISKTPREIIGPEIEFCKDHNLLIYPKTILAQMPNKLKSNVINVSDENDDNESDNSENLSDIDEDMPLPKGDFH